VCNFVKYSPLIGIIHMFVVSAPYLLSSPCLTSLFSDLVFSSKLTALSNVENQTNALKNHTTRDNTLSWSLLSKCDIF